ncbi:MAG: FAD-dependent oxidoreductase [Candidatus Merdivicinus sp.]
MHTQWIDALEFQEYGGFHPETQFVQEMGQGYLLAMEVPGIPVAPARTGFHVPEEGMYRIWVRCKNWLRQASPGKLRVLVDGRYLPRELGALPTEQWSWEAAGDLHLQPGAHQLTVEDTTGYFGRFAAVVVTSDMDFTPEHKVERLWKERASLRGEPLEPEERGSWDVIVAGGGPAGVPAAIAAARKGLKVALVHSRPGLGGNASDEGTVGFDGAYCHHPYMRETGIAEEIRRIHDHNGLTWEGALRTLAEREENLVIFYNQFVMDACTRDNHIESIVSIDCQSGRFYRFCAKMFIDCTGDGWLGYWAGAKYRLGREARWQYDEPLAPESPDNLTMSGCLMGSIRAQQILGYYAEDAGEPVAFTAPDWAVHLPEGSDLHRFPGRLHTGEWWVENPTDMDDLWEQEAIRDELLRLNLGYFHWLKNSYERRDLARNLRLTGFGRYNARRENRRLIGDYVLTENDCREGRRFPDAVSYCGWNIDVHHPRGIYSGGEGPFYAGYPIPITEIPYRCLYSKNIENLFMAGRCVSVSHLALGTVRVENTLATLGQAAATAAYLAIRCNTTPRGVGENYLEELQQTLLRDDLFIPSVRSKDPHDLARTAAVWASSFSRTEGFTRKKGVLGDWIPLDRRRIMSCPVRKPPEFVEACLRNESAVPVPVRALLAVMAHPGDYEQMTITEQTEVTVPGSYCGYVSIPFAVVPKEGAMGLLLEPAESISWREIRFACDGRQRGEPINAYRWNSDFSNTYDVRFETEVLPLADCRPEMAVNGCSRICSAEEYGWVSDPLEPLPQQLTLEWTEPHNIGQIQLVFDTDLTNPSYSYLRQADAAGTVRDYTLEARCGDTWKTVWSEKGNYQRRRLCEIAESGVSAVRITVEATWGSPSARILEVRVYEREN